MKQTDYPFVVAALYKFQDWPDFAGHQAPLRDLCEREGVSGTLLVAHEGINGTIAGSRAGIDAVVSRINQILGFDGVEYKESFAATNPFYRMKVRLKKEIVTMGVPGTDPKKTVGSYVAPEDWNALIADPNTILVDTRNDYEVDIGTFKGAIDPKTDSFREFPDWFKAQKELQPDSLEGKKLAMFCTGGIRCEKATAFVKDLGIDQVFHLKGGILKYLETVPAEKSLWEGECFVFDERVSVKHGLELGSYDLCRACRHPIDEDDKKSPHYVPGVSCPMCHDAFDDKQKKRFADRQKQIQLARERGEKHIGAVQNSKPNVAKGETVDVGDAGLSDAEKAKLPILYSFRRCPYAMRGRLGLLASGTACRLREVVLQDKPAALLEASPKGTVPVLQAPDGQVIDESLDVMLWALDQNDPDGWLRPDQGSLDEMRALIRENDGPFKRNLDRYKYPDRFDDSDGAHSHRAAGLEFLSALDQRLAGGGQLFGTRPSLADFAIFPFVRQFANTDRDWFDAQDLPNLQGWLADHLASPIFKTVMKKYKVWQAGDDEPVFSG